MYGIEGQRKVGFEMSKCACQEITTYKMKRVNQLVFQSTDIPQHTQLPTVSTYRTKYWLSTSERATTGQLLHALPIQTQIYQSTDIPQNAQLPTVSPCRTKY